MNGCTAIKDSSNFEVISFEQGKMKEIDGEWVVYEKGDEIKYTENGMCVFNKQPTTCMWHGFILKYNSHGKDVYLNCKGYQDVPGNYGNPSELIKDATNTFEYNIPLKGNTNIFINPQYITHIPVKTEIKSVTLCKLDGEDVLKFKQVFIFTGTKKA